MPLLTDHGVGKQRWSTAITAGTSSCDIRSILIWGMPPSVYRITVGAGRWMNHRVVLRQNPLDPAVVAEIAARFRYPDYEVLDDNPPELRKARDEDRRFRAWLDSPPTPARKGRQLPWLHISATRSSSV